MWHCRLIKLQTGSFKGLTKVSGGKIKIKDSAAAEISLSKTSLNGGKRVEKILIKSLKVR